MVISFEVQDIVWPLNSLYYTEKVAKLNLISHLNTLKSAKFICNSLKVWLDRTNLSNVVIHVYRARVLGQMIEDHVT